MSFKFSREDAADLINMIRRRRPEWTEKGILSQLQTAAEHGASLGQVTTAAEKTWNNPKAKTPAALLWAEHWEVTTTKAVNLTGARYCVECNPARKHPIADMTQVGPGQWICDGHGTGKENNA